MKKTRYTGWHVKYLPCVMAAVIGLMPPCAVIAAQQENAININESGAADDSENNTDPAADSGSDDDAGNGTAEDSENTDEAADGSENAAMKYITGMEALPEEEAYFPCMYKPSLEELLSVFPEALSVYLDGEEEAFALEVAWECEDDFESTAFASYIFVPKWDETQYAIVDSASESVEIPFIVVEVPSDGGIIKDPEAAKSVLQDILQKKSILALVYLCDEYEVKQSASADSETVHTVVSGQSVQITGVESDEYGSVWYQVLLYQNGSEYTGYVEKEYLVTSDEEFAAWEDTYLDMSAVPMAMTVSEGYPDIDQFPASYQNALYALKEKHPAWTFVRMDTGLDWNTVIASEMGDKSLVPSKSSGSWQNGVYGQGWSYASEGILKYYMDPRNFLTDPSVFQFEQLTYNGSYHTTEAVQEIIKNSFMSSSIPGDSQTYAQAFTAIGAGLGISPFHLASRVLQEQGTKGTSSLISGTYPGYEGYYNYFNVGAAGKTDYLVVTSGLKTAVSYGWNTRYKALYGGSRIIGANYILKGQDTLYLEKFNVASGRHANFTHQYMQNIQAPASEASGIRKAYANAGALENSFVFKIPVFNNMPASACSRPEMTDVITLNKETVDNLEIGKTVTLVPYVNGSKVDHVGNMTFTSSNTAVATVDSQGKVTAVSTGTAVISCTRSKANTASCTITVVKANPVVSTPTLSPIVYQDGLQLSGIPLPDGWKWENGNIKVSVGTYSYSAVYTPADSDKYNNVKKEISFTVTRAIPSCKVPENLKAQTGMVLGDVALPSGFVWESSAETELLAAGEFTFYVSYNPDENNYYTVSNIPVILYVMGEDQEPSGDGDNSGGNLSMGSTSGGGTSTGGSSSSVGSTTTSGGSTITSGGSTTTSSGSTSTSGGSTTISGGSTITSGGSTSTSGGSTITSGGSTTTSGGSTITSGGSTTTSGGSTITSGGSTTTSGGSTSTSGGSTITSGGSTVTSGGSTTTSGGSTITSGGSTTTSGGSTVTSSGSTTTSGGSTTTSGGSITTSGGSTATSGGSTVTPSGSAITSGGSTAAPAGSTSEGGTQTTDGSATGGIPGSNASIPAGNTTNENVEFSAGNTSGQNVPAGNTPGTSGAAENPALVTMPSNHENETNNNGSVPGNGNSQNSGTAATVVNPPASADAGTAGSSAAEGDVPEQSGMEDSALPSVAEEPEEVSFKPSVTIQMDDTTILTAETLQMAKEQNFNLLLAMGDYASWSINIDSVNVGAFTAADMGVIFGTNTIPQELIAAILDGNKYLELTLAHDGEFGFELALRITLSAVDCGRYANLFYFDPETEALEFICDSIINADGVASFPMDHASSYVIIVSDQSMADLLFSEEPENSMVKWIILGTLLCMVLVVAGYAVFFYSRKRREEGYDGEEQDDEEEEYDEDDMAGDKKLENNKQAYGKDGGTEMEESEEERYLDEDEPDEIEIEEMADEEEDAEVRVRPREQRREEKKPSLQPERHRLQMFNLKESLPGPRNAEESAEEDEEDDWIEDDEWEEPEVSGQKPAGRFDDDHAENDWIEDDEWDIGNDWIDDEEWERTNGEKQ